MTEPLPFLQKVISFQKAAKAWAQQARRNGQQLTQYADRCAQIVHGLDCALRKGGSPDNAEHLQNFLAVMRLKQILLTLHPTIVEESDCPGATSVTCDTWKENHESIKEALGDLYRHPFKIPTEPYQEELEMAAKVDQWIWIGWLRETIRNDSSGGFKEERALVQQVAGLGHRFRMQNGETCSAITMTIMSVVYAMNSGNDPQVKIALDDAVRLLRNPSSNLLQNQPYVPPPPLSAVGP